METNSSGKKYLIAAEFVKIFHILIITYMTFGWIVNNSYVWLSIMLLAPLFHIHWKTNKDTCILTDIEKKLRGNNEIKGTFIGGLAKKILKKELSDSMISKLAYGVMYSSAIICFSRYQLT
tara:strand:+ start:149 stop:511 length:363 start_codon:yes stop_codon:yes gene_type:complete